MFVFHPPSPPPPFLLYSVSIPPKSAFSTIFLQTVQAKHSKSTSRLGEGSRSLVSTFPKRTGNGSVALGDVETLNLGLGVGGGVMEAGKVRVKMAGKEP